MSYPIKKYDKIFYPFISYNCSYRGNNKHYTLKDQIRVFVLKTFRNGTQSFASVAEFSCRKENCIFRNKSQSYFAQNFGIPHLRNSFNTIAFGQFRYFAVSMLLIIHFLENKCQPGQIITACF